MQLVFAHAGLMAAGAIAMTSAVAIAMTQRKKRWWLKAHRPIGISGAVLMLAGLSAVALMPDSASSGSILEVHGLTGGLAAAAGISTVSLGLMMFSLKKKWMRPVHRWAGWSAVLITFINIALGLAMVGL